MLKAGPFFHLLGLDLAGTLDVSNTPGAPKFADTQRCSAKVVGEAGGNPAMFGGLR
ncbi:hypothetical protein FA13DRAFT_1737984 [Coprinellus micaceus]|uniref:Uncharacterized protein n=1 Tax=Coprinellus micaceus TaxID=71717 RepID=A0A4Y7SVW0_COPMI|nr:hypothetical protein FA13DRAFT_1737984 [Coprinellus micaceus]